MAELNKSKTAVETGPDSSSEWSVLQEYVGQQIEESYPQINLDHDYGWAKAYLQKYGCRNESVWEHLNDIINYVINAKPQDCMRYFEEMSRELRIRKFFLKNDHLRDVIDDPIQVELAREKLKFYRRVQCFYEEDNPFTDESPMDTNMLFNIKLLEDAGIGIPIVELFDTYLAIRVLARTKPLAKCRFWGKIFGTQRDYVIVEAELTPEEHARRLEIFATQPPKGKTGGPDGDGKGDIPVGDDQFHLDVKDIPDTAPVDETENIEPAESKPGGEVEEANKEENKDTSKLTTKDEEWPKKKRLLATYKMPPLPKPFSIEEVIVPIEPPGVGCNRCVYYVLTDPTEAWVELPDVTPLQIVRARLTTKYVSGIVEREVVSFPEFPGKEKEFLRAQIARISAATHVSPIGFYQGEGEEEAALELEEGQLFAENTDYQPLPVEDLLSPSLEFWVHHTQYILNQGRTSYWTPPGQGDMMDEMDEELQGPPEFAPEILRPLAQDAYPELGGALWTARRAYNLIGNETPVVLRSNIWPGAQTVVKGSQFVNFYVGFGNKNFPKGFNPYMPMVTPQSEYEIGPEVMEILDPTPEMEELEWLKLNPPPYPFDPEEEEEEEPGGGGPYEEESENEEESV